MFERLMARASSQAASAASGMVRISAGAGVCTSGTQGAQSPGSVIVRAGGDDAEQGSAIHIRRRFEQHVDGGSGKIDRLIATRQRQTPVFLHDR